MVSAVNAGLDQHVFSLRLHGDPKPTDTPQFFDFELPDGVRARGSVRELAYGELSIFAAMKPTGKAMGCANADLTAGEAYGQVWLERISGAWVDPFLDTFECKNSALERLSKMDVAPAGFGDSRTPATANPG